MARSNKASYGKAAASQPGRGEVAEGAAIEATIASEQAPLKLEKFLPYQLNVVASLVSLALSRVYARRYGIGVPEWRVLVTLGQYGVMTGKAIGAHTHMHKTKVSRAVALMEQRKLLVRRANRADMREFFSRSPRRDGRCTKKSRRTRSPLPADSPISSRQPTAKRSIVRSKLSPSGPRNWSPSW